MKKDLKEAISWLEKILGNHSFQISPLRQEASERSYFRITLKNDSYVLMNNFGSKENAANFIKIEKILKDEKVNVPDIFGFSDELDYLLLEDLGDITLDEYDELSEEDKLTVARARKIQRFLSQPFFVAEVFTGSPGKLVDLNDTIKGFDAICKGEYDHLPEAAFYMVGGIEEVIEKAEKLSKDSK